MGLAYNWGDTLFAEFVRQEIARTRPAGAPEIRIVTAEDGAWTRGGTSAMVAELHRARAFVEDSSVVAVVGPGGSREALQVGPIYRDANVVELVLTATSRLLEPLREWTLTLAPNDSIQGEFIGQFADSALMARRVAIFYVTDEYGVGLASGVAAALASRGVEVVLRTPLQLSQDCRVPAERSEYEAMIAQLARRGTVDAVVIAARQTEAGCLARLIRRRWPAIHLLAGDGVTTNETLFALAAGAAEGMHIVAFWHPEVAGGEAQDFVSRFEIATARPFQHSDAVYYDAVMLTVAAIRSEGASRAAVARYLRSLGGSRPPYQGLTGPVAFTPGFRRPLVMTRVTGNSVRPVGSR